VKNVHKGNQFEKQYLSFIQKVRQYKE
jgi:hypothetical protein